MSSRDGHAWSGGNFRRRHTMKLKNDQKKALDVALATGTRPNTARCATLAAEWGCDVKEVKEYVNSHPLPDEAEQLDGWWENEGGREIKTLAKKKLATEAKTCKVSAELNLLKAWRAAKKKAENKQAPAIQGGRRAVGAAD